jgi:hypothetical protein
VADNAELLNAVVQALECRRFELSQSMRNHTTARFERSLEPTVEMHVQAVREKMATSKHFGIANQFVEREADGCVIGGDNRAGTHTDDRIYFDAVAHQLSKHSNVSGAAKATSAEHKRDPNRFRRDARPVRSTNARDWPIILSLQID